MPRPLSSSPSRTIAILLLSVLLPGMLSSPVASFATSQQRPAWQATPGTLTPRAWLPLVFRSYTPAPPPPTGACVVTRSTGTAPIYATTHPKVLLNDAATKSCLQQLLAANVPAALRFKSMVDGQLAGANHYAFEPWFAALLYQVTGQAEYGAYAVAQSDAFVAAEEALIAGGQRPEVAFDSYLYVGDHIGSLMLVYDWCYTLLTPAQRARWLAYANQAVWNVWHHEQAEWGGNPFPWSGWSVDNPANNYYYSFLRATMTLGLSSRGENAQAQTWIDTFRTAKLENQLFPTFNSDLQGGGSREGTGYGTALRGLFRLYDWWERSTGERIATKTPHTLASIAHLMHNIVPTLDRLAPTGDHARDSSAALFDYHREYLLELMALFPDEPLSGAAHTLLTGSSVPEMEQRFMFVADYLYYPPALTPRPLATLSTAYWGSGTGQFMMRSSWETSATFANFICGPYTESHAHRDQGSFVLYKNTWLAYDANIDSQSGIEQDEQMHNLVRIVQNGSTVRQVESAPRCEMLALADTAQFAYGLARVTPVYNGHAAIGKVEREFLFIKPDVVVVFDRVETSGAGVQRIWTLNMPGAPTVSGDHISYVQGANRLDVQRLTPAGLTSQLVGGSRVETAHSAGNQSLFLHVLGVNGAVSTTARSDASGQTGAQVTLADGRTLTVRFSNAGTGGTLDLRAANGAGLFNAALPITVTVPPLFVD